MDSDHELRIWRRETITAATEETLILLRDRALPGDAYLAGGTGLALQFGHRRSLDLVSVPLLMYWRAREA